FRGRHASGRAVGPTAAWPAGQRIAEESRRAGQRQRARLGRSGGTRARLSPTARAAASLVRAGRMLRHRRSPRGGDRPSLLDVIVRVYRRREVIMSPNAEPRAHPQPDGQAIAAFRAALRGTLLQPGDDAYDATRVVWNGMIDRRPSLIARCQGVADVM